MRQDLYLRLSLSHRDICAVKGEGGGSPSANGVGAAPTERASACPGAAEVVDQPPAASQLVGSRQVRSYTVKV
jgi:hypothetical protein